MTGTPRPGLTFSLMCVVRQVVFAATILYSTTLLLIKFSILLFYNRLFSTKRFRYVSYALAAFILACWISLLFSHLFQCNTVSANFAASASTRRACLDFTADDVLSTANLCTDIFLLVMPWPIVLKLQVTRERKMQLLGIFLLGSL